MYYVPICTTYDATYCTFHWHFSNQSTIDSTRPFRIAGRSCFTCVMDSSEAISHCLTPGACALQTSALLVGETRLSPKNHLKKMSLGIIIPGHLGCRDVPSFTPTRKGCSFSKTRPTANMLRKVLPSRFRLVWQQLVLPMFDKPINLQEDGQKKMCWCQESTSNSQI